ncbi:uncharacterized protein DUF1538 [Natranaerovirga hydrolytica]|uniref:Uncharacterized protein DUF1538 n=1 Tax=Natranaerovirga hydrolytica TaxID=680378 RepID=A0A4R1MKG9_9FIRM|nr:DUF1538 domain-containing protein [Natranaerovirga hydrolytica]TCK93318.1 uncharacterized protein DUF1538 [Natranaerovirga hydrolytica]
MNIFTEKLKDIFFAILPVTLIVIMLRVTIVPIENKTLIMFLMGAVLIIIGLALFLVGVDIGITPLGSSLGKVIAKKNKLWFVIVAGFVLGFFISFAEPGLLVLSNQIDAITLGGISNITILFVVSLGIAIMMVVGFIRILFNLPLHIILNISYALILVLSIFTSREFIGIAFDASGSTTGVLAVPFILALSLGITGLKKDSKASEKDSFGLIAIVSVGAIITVMLLNIISPDLQLSGTLEIESFESIPIVAAFISLIPSALIESAFAFLPLIVVFIVICLVTNTFTKKEIKAILFGFLYAFLGLFLFFLGVNGGFMEVGSYIGSYLTTLSSNAYLIIVGFILGVVTILAEPAVYVLTHQIEDVTAGYVKRIAVIIALSIGVGIAVALSMLRVVVPEIQLWHYLLPGYLISLLLTFIVPKLFVGIAFDAGGVATGPMTATFILAFTHGAADAYFSADLLIDGFGMIAMVALMPIITLQILGLIYKIKTEKKVGV